MFIVDFKQNIFQDLVKIVTIKSVLPLAHIIFRVSELFIVSMLAMFRIPSFRLSNLCAYFELAVADLKMRDSVFVVFCPHVLAFVILKIFADDLVIGDDCQHLF